MKERTLYARIHNGLIKDIIMPSPNGLMEIEAPATLNWYQITWPINPHFTGVMGIRKILQEKWSQKERDCNNGN